MSPCKRRYEALKCYLLSKRKGKHYYYSGVFRELLEKRKSLSLFRSLRALLPSLRSACAGAPPTLVALSVGFSIFSLSLPLFEKNYLPFLDCYSFFASSNLISFASSPQKHLVWKSQNTKSKLRTQVNQ